MLTAPQKEEFIALLKRYQQHTASPEEVEFLESYYRYFDQEEKQSLNLSEQEKALLETRILRNIERMIQSGQQPITHRVIPLYHHWKKIAAVLLLLVLGGGSIYFFRNISSAPTATGTRLASDNFKNDLNPGTNKAILTLADGSRIVLDSVQNGNISTQGNARIVKFDSGTLAYQMPSLRDGKSSSEEIQFNTITIPNGGQYQIILADGSKVWLNAASSLRFPSSFKGDDRHVELRGEAYFEIAKHNRVTKNGSERVPFTVHSNGIDVQVLGTHFNINAYENEGRIKTTLLEGSVKVSRGNASMLLRPGNQSDVDGQGNMKFIASANVDDAVAWKNGMFQFHSADIQTIMRQLARWYDVDVEYSQNLNEKFYIEIPRNTRASEIFKILETTGAVHFEIDGRKVKVRP